MVLGLASAGLVAASVNGCAGDDTSGLGAGGDGTSATTGVGGAGTTTTTTTTDDSSSISGPTTSASSGMSCTGGTPDDDLDGDGFSENQGDCNDCDAEIGPNAVEVIATADPGMPPPTPADEDCDGKIDVLPPPCDDNLEVTDPDPMNAAKAIGACRFVSDAKWVVADGTPPPVGATQLANFHKGHGILDNLGANNPPREGTRMLMVSSGTARKEGDPEYVHRNFDKGYSSNPPFGFPKDSASCPGVTTGPAHDATGLEVTFVAPQNAHGIKFDFNFFTFEWPKFICTTFNDFFVANMSPFPMGQTDGNISFDQQMNPISVNAAFLSACACPGGPPCNAPPNQPVKAFDCAIGNQQLTGTDFDADDANPGWSNGATGWLTTSAPVEPGLSFTIRFVTYDSSDGFVDSSTLIDNWQWTATAGKVQTVPN